MCAHDAHCRGRRAEPVHRTGGEADRIDAGRERRGVVVPVQEWLDGSWADLGATSTSAARSVSYRVAGLRTFRVVVAYTSATTGESAPVSVQWRAMSVSVSASPEYPIAGDAATSTVTLTATADAPSDATYRWQEWTNGAWTNLSSTSTEQTATSSTRGTRKFRVVVSHSVVPSAESEPVYVTWDEWAIVADMIRELSSAVATSTAYTTAQDALLSCMSATATSTTISTSTGSVPKSGRGARSHTLLPAATFASFDELLASYTGDVKARMGTGGDCAATSTAMFGTNESVAREELARLKAGNAVYAAWLATPQGQLFETNLGDADELKFVSYLGATTFEPGELTAPLYAPPDDDGATGQDGPDEEELPIVGTGLDCLPQSVSNGADLTLANKLVVLNCLVFSTPHEFWVQGDNGSRDAERLRRAIDSPSARFAWLDRGDWECTLSPDGPIPSCLKHDVAYGGLQKFAGMNANTSLTAPPDGTELDETWNPRNKALADAKFKADIANWGCQDPSNVAKFGVCRIPRGVMADQVYFWGTARVNHKGWPVTTRDLSHIDGHYRFIVCREPVVPTVSGLTVSRLGDVITASWTLEPGCVPVTLADVTFKVRWGIRGYVPMLLIPNTTSSNTCTTCAERGYEVTCSYDFRNMSPGTRIDSIDIYVTPRDKEYGGINYGGEGKTGRRHTLAVGPFEF